MRAEVVAVGTELLLGQVIDTNSAWIGEHLAMSGVDCNFQTRVGDNIGRIASALRAALARNEAVVICGGLGPTQDDVTREAIALVMNVPLVRDAAVLKAIRDRFASRRPGWTMPENNERQADVPEGATVIPQTMGTAPGLICPVGNKVMYAVPGVPYELHDMLERAVLPDLRRRSGQASVIRSRTLRTWGHTESGVAELVKDRVEALESGGPGVPTIAFLASGVEGIKVRVTVKADDELGATALLDAEEAELRAVLGESVFGVDEETMESASRAPSPEAGLEPRCGRVAHRRPRRFQGRGRPGREHVVPRSSGCLRRRCQAVAARRGGRAGRDKRGGGGDGRWCSAGPRRRCWTFHDRSRRPVRAGGPTGGHGSRRPVPAGDNP